jgi:hypothetical protein
LAGRSDTLKNEGAGQRSAWISQLECGYEPTYLVISSTVSKLVPRARATFARRGSSQGDVIENLGAVSYTQPCRVRVFISHSSKDLHATEVLERLHAALAQHFAVKLDRADLQPGDNWRAEINTWLGYCEAAVILLSEDALKSPYVAFEASILAHRKSAQDRFPLIPVFLGAVDYASVENSIMLSPSRIHDIQSVIRISDPAAIVAAVLAKLQQAQANSTPVDKQVDVLADLLSDVPDYLIREAASKVAVDLGSWNNPEDQRRNLALKVLSAGMLEARKVLLEIRIAWKADPKRLSAAIQLAGCSWVDLPTAQKIPAIRTKPIRAMALKAREQLTALMYVTRAGAGCEARTPLDPWPVAPVSGAVSETAFDDLLTMVCAFLADATKLAAGDDLDEALQAYEESSWPVFVSLSSQIVDYDCLTQLRHRFPTVTFILLTGDSEIPPKFVQLSGIETFAAKTPGDNEIEYCRTYESYHRFLHRGLNP